MRNEMKWIRHNNETASYNYEMKFIRFHISMKELIALLKKQNSAQLIPPTKKKSLIDFFGINTII